VICVKFEQCKRGILSNVVFCGCVTMSKNFIARTKPRDDDDDDIESRLLYVRVFLCFISFVMCCVERVERALDHFLSVVLSTFTTNLHAQKRLVVEEIETFASSSSITINV
jgi:hypothetical protein